MDKLNDDTLVALIRQGDSHAELLLYQKYWGFAKNLGRKIYLNYKYCGISEDEFTSVAYASVMESVKTYTGKNSFYRFWLIIAQNECIDYLRENAFYGKLNINGVVSLDNSLNLDMLSFHEMVGVSDDNFSDLINETYYFFIRDKEMNLSKEEKIAAYYVLYKQLDISEIAYLTKWSKQKVYRLVKKVKTKVSNFIKSRYFMS